MNWACSFLRDSFLAVAATLFGSLAVLTFALPASAACAAPAGPHVFYVTDRASLDNDLLFSGERGLTADHQGIISRGILTRGDTPAIVIKSPCATQQAFFNALRRDFDPKRGRSVLVYVHGYYTSMKQAGRDALTLQQTLRYPGPVILYSWPSKVTSRLAYVNDEANANWSLVHFNDFLGALVAEYPGLPISFVSHSLGARFAAAGIAFLHYSRCPNCFARAVFFAPDIDGDTLRAGLASSGLCRGKPAPAPVTAARVTLYVSNRDRALRQSQKLHGHQRAGQAGSELLLCNGVNTIDVSYFGVTDSYGHSYQAEPAINADSREALAGISPASPRRKLTPVNRAAGTYYELR